LSLSNLLNNAKSSFAPSPYQQKVFDFVENGQGNAVVNAVAGSGKTTTIVEALKLVPMSMSSIFVAFNKSIVEELQRRIPSSTDVKTIHAIGRNAIVKYFDLPAKLPKDYVDGRKYITYAKKFSRGWDVVTETAEEENKSLYIKKISAINDLMRQNLYTENTPNDTIAFTCANNGIVAFDICIERAKQVMDAGITDERKIDFIDMLVFPVYYDMPVEKRYDWVFVDECQDLNKAQQAILKKLVKDNGRWVAVGDPKQAIYGFAGADIHSFNTLKSSDNTIELPLSISYRCSKEVVKYAQKLVPHLECSPTAPDGQVNEKGLLEHIQDGDFVLCRNAYPLVKCAIRFLSKGRRISIIGSDIGKSLVEMIDKTSENEVDKMFVELNKQRDRMVYRLMNKGYDWSEAIEHNTVTEFDEKMSMIKAISDGFSFERVLPVIEKIESIFGEEEKSGVTFATIHKAKGLEADRVHIICRELMPSPKAKQDWQIMQEYNLMYVAYTRAKLLLSFVEDFSV